MLKSSLKSSPLFCCLRERDTITDENVDGTCTSYKGPTSTFDGGAAANLSYDHLDAPIQELTGSDLALEGEGHR